jgi:hypothetical protein
MFIQQGSCQRYLRLAMLRRSPGPDPIRQYGVTEAGLTPLLGSTGMSYERRVEDAITSRFSTLRLGQGDTRQRESDNAVLLREARRLASGLTRVLFQVRLRAVLGSWDLSGDADLIVLKRDTSGSLSILVADIKSSTRPHLQHRLQVAFYARMIEDILAGDDVRHEPLRHGILYRPSAPDRLALDPELAGQVANDRLTAQAEFGTDVACLSLVDDTVALSDTVDDLVLGQESDAARIAEQPFPDVPFHLTPLCDGCRINEFCMKWAAEHDDLSLVPFLTGVEKAQLLAAGITTTRELADLKRLVPRPDGAYGPSMRMVPQPEHEATVRALATRPPVGPRLDELIARAQKYRKGQGDDFGPTGSIPGAGKGSLPAVSLDRHPNLVWIYVDPHVDYLNGRLYLLAARVVACENGQPARETSIVEMTDGPPDDPLTEREMIGRWAKRLLEAVVTTAAPDPETGTRRAPIHLVFHSGADVSALLDGFGRHLEGVFGTTALYDFVTQPAAYDSPLVTELDEEIRTRQNLPLIAQSLIRTAQYYGFDWDDPRPFRELFRERMFDFTGRLDADGDGPGNWYTRRARFRSSIPLEYAYGLWGRLERSPSGNRDTAEPYLAPSREEFLAFVERRLDAIRFVSGKLRPNEDAGKSSFDLPDLATYENRAHTLADALLEFLQIERHVEISAWRRVRQQEPERRMAMGQAWVASFHDADQPAETREALRVARERFDEAARRRAAGDELTKEERAALQWSLAEHPLRFRIALEGSPDATAVAETLAMSELKADEWAVLSPRTTVDERLPEGQRNRFTPTARQLLYAPRVEIIDARSTDDGRAWLDLTLMDQRGGTSGNGYSFGPRRDVPRDGETYTVDPNPDDYNGLGLHQTITQVADGRPNTLFDYLVADTPAGPAWPEMAREGQRRFLDGLVALHEAGILHGFEPGKHDFIGHGGEEPVVLVQGPPGTGKSYTTSFAIFSRLQGAMAAGLDYRVAAGCKTHSATDVIRDGILKAQRDLARWHGDHPELFRRFFDARLLDVPILRTEPRGPVPEGITPIWRKDKAKEAGPGDRISLKGITQDPHLIMTGVPGAIRAIDQDQKGRKVQYRERPFHCLVLDEASQMNLPEAIMAARLLAPGGQVVVVGDHRQMAPIVKHDWEGERRRTFQQYAAYKSLFDTLRFREHPPRTIRFEESFRLHADMASFLKQEVYRHDGIDYHSNKKKTLQPSGATDAFVSAVLDPAYPLVVVEHGEGTSQTRNDFEVRLMAPVLATLATLPGADAAEGLGVVVPHRAQRTAFQQAVPELTFMDGDEERTAVDTVEKFQGGERTAMVFAATQSDPGYLATRAGFLFDPKRLTVAMSRAKEKMILVGSRNIFTFFSPDEEIYANALLWKNLRRRTCRELLWEGEIDGYQVKVLGNAKMAIDEVVDAARPADVRTVVRAAGAEVRR